jgi:hypothetical protein
MSSRTIRRAWGTAASGVAICLREIPRERFGNRFCGEGEEFVVGGIERVVGAAGVVVAEGDVDGDAGEGFAERRDDVLDRLLGEGEVIGVGRCGQERAVLAVELVGEEVAAEGDEPGVRRVGVDGVEAGQPEGVGGVDAADGAGGLEGGEVSRLGGGVGLCEDRGPVGGRSRVELRDFGGIVVGIEVDVGEEERRDG